MMHKRLVYSFWRACKSTIEFDLPRCMHTEAVMPHQLFNAERRLQLSDVKRLKKIEVSCSDIISEPLQEPLKLQMNQDLSTPYSCTKHISDLYSRQTALALVNGKEWHMHRPLTEDCDIKFLHFRQDDPTILNQAFWRSCAFVLGSVLERAFKPECKISLQRAVDFKVESGSFAYDFTASFGDWHPTERELLAISQLATRLSFGSTNRFLIQPLEVSKEKAKEIFKQNSYKQALLDDPRFSSDSVTLYRMGAHVDLAPGVLIAGPWHIGRFNVMSIHKLGDTDAGTVYRAQGVALPSTIAMHSWTYNLLLSNATKLNESEEILSEDEGEAEGDTKLLESSDG